MRGVKYGGEGRRIARCHGREQMAETGVGKRARKGEGENDRQTGKEREREKNLDQAEKGLEFTLGNAVSRTGKT